MQGGRGGGGGGGEKEELEELRVQRGRFISKEGQKNQIPRILV